MSGSQVQPWLQQQAAHGLTALSGAQQIGERHWRIDLCNPGDHEREQEISALQQGEQRKAEHAFCMAVHHDSSCTSAGSGNDYLFGGKGKDTLIGGDVIEAPDKLNLRLIQRGDHLLLKDLDNNINTTLLNINKNDLIAHQPDLI